MRRFVSQGWDRLVGMHMSPSCFVLVRQVDDGMIELGADQGVRSVEECVWVLFFIL